MRKFGKKSLVWTLVLSLVLMTTAVFGSVVPTASAATVLFSENFNSYSNGTLPTNWKVASPSGVTDISVQDGGLVIKAKGTSDAQTGVVYQGSELKNVGDYTFEADYTILESDYALSSSTRYSSMLFRVDSSTLSGGYYSPFYYVTARVRNNTSPNELTYRPNSSSYHQITTAQPVQNMALNTTYHLKVVARGTNIQYFIDDDMIFNTTLATDSDKYAYLTKGTIGFNTSNLTVRFDNVVVTAVDPDVELQPALYDTYKPNTSIINPPTVVTHVTGSTAYNKITASTRMPSTAIYYVNQDLNVTTPDGQTVITTLKAALKNTSGKVIPALFVKDQATVAALKTFAVDWALQDAFIVADNVTMLKYARTQLRQFYGVLYTKLTTAATEADLNAMIADTNIGLGKIIMVDADYVSKDDITYMQKRLMNVWVLKDNMTATETYENIYKGVNGLVTTTPGDTVYVLETINTNVPTLVREPFMYAHRGYSAAAPQNTIPAFRAAIDAGADLIEMDVRQTKDGRVVIYHDNELHTLTDCADTTKTVENSTYAELMQYNVDCMDGYREKIVTLEEFLDLIAQTDVVGIVELKNYDAALIPLVADIIRAKNMEHKVVSIAFGAGQAAALRQALPSVSVGLLANYDAKYTTADTVLNWAKNCCLEYNFSFHPNTGVIHTSDAVMKSNMLEMASIRGFQYQPWTYASQARFDTSYVNGIQGLTTDYLEYDDGYMRKLVGGASYRMKHNVATTLEAVGYTSLGYTKLPCEFVRTGGNAISFSFAGDQVTASGTGTAYGYLRYKVTTDTAGSYFIMSAPTQVVVSDTAGSTPMSTMNTSLLPAYVGRWYNSISG
ncbi:MAG: DUF1080 domain-containing protein, partial [Clostridia bacterium]|nr:DUF1080 domain-containing protein [Clostridia bacterium]